MWQQHADEITEKSGMEVGKSERPIMATQVWRSHSLIHSSYLMFPIIRCYYRCWVQW